MRIGVNFGDGRAETINIPRMELMHDACVRVKARANCAPKFMTDSMKLFNTVLRSSLKEEEDEMMGR